MSVVQYIRAQNKFTKFVNKGVEFIERIGTNAHVFFPYRTNLMHPAFCEILNNPPVRYCTYRKAKLLHLVEGIGSCKDINKPIIFEIIDHPLSVAASISRKFLEPFEYIKCIDEIENFYINQNLKCIILISNGQKELFRRYFSNEYINKKLKVIKLPWRRNFAIDGMRSIDTGKNLKCLLIASDYFLKGVFIFTEAWKMSKVGEFGGNKLTIICHNASPSCQAIKGVEVIRKIPLTNLEKDRYYQDCNLVATVTLTDGISGIEALSYGKPIICYKCQHSSDWVDSHNGYEVDTALNLYDSQCYGIKWLTNDDYKDAVKKHYKNGMFDKAIVNISELLKMYHLNKELLCQQSHNSMGKFLSDHTVEKRNDELRMLYDLYV